MGPSCTVVIPAYNAARFICEALESLCAQTISNWRAVVVDDGSTDDTFALASSMPDPRIQVLRQENRGVSSARNRGFEEVDSTYVIFLDADDRLCPDALARFMYALERERALSAVYGEGEIIDESGTVIQRARRPRFNLRPMGDVLPAILRRNFILSGGALCARTERVREAGLFREDLRLHEDWEHWCRLAQTGPFKYLGHEPVFQYRRTSGGVVDTSGTDIALAMRNVEAVFANPRLQRRFKQAQLARMRRKSEASVYSFAANQYLKAGQLGEARGALVESIRRQPMQPREWALLALAATGCMPRGMVREIK